MISRIDLILKTKNLSPAQFADQIGIQRSSLSHLLSGRNNPSLDFVQKVLTRFPDLEPNWLLFGKGVMYKDGTAEQAPVVSQIHQDDYLTNNQLNFFDTPPVQAETITPIAPLETLNTTENTIPNAPQRSENVNNNEIDRIILFFKNGTFKVYNK